jgi:hypothetical protein
MRMFLALVFALVFTACSRQDQPSLSRVPSVPESDGSTQSRRSPGSIRDTVVEKELHIGETFPVGRMIWTVHVEEPDDSVVWSICAIVDGDTAFLHKGNSSWFKPSMATPAGRRDSSSQKVPWYTHDFFAFERDSLAVDDPRRKMAKRFPQHQMARYLQEHGMTASAAAQAEAAFGMYFENLPIILFRFPEYPAGGDQRSFAYHPTIRWFLPVSIP